MTQIGKMIFDDGYNAGRKQGEKREDRNDDPKTTIYPLTEMIE